MKLIFKTRKSFGDTDLVHRGIQLDCQVVEYGYDTPEEIKAVGFICDSMREICKDGGMFLKFLPRRVNDALATKDTPVKNASPEMLALKTRLNTAIQQANSYKAMYEELRRKTMGVN